MKILILGTSGYAGQAIAQKLEENHEVYGTYHTQESKCIARNRMIKFGLSKSDSKKKYWIAYSLKLLSRV